MTTMTKIEKRIYRTKSNSDDNKVSHEVENKNKTKEKNPDRKKEEIKVESSKKIVTPRPEASSKLKVVQLNFNNLGYAPDIMRKEAFEFMASAGKRMPGDNHKLDISPEVFDLLIKNGVEFSKCKKSDNLINIEIRETMLRFSIKVAFRYLCKKFTKYKERCILGNFYDLSSYNRFFLKTKGGVYPYELTLTARLNDKFLDFKLRPEAHNNTYQEMRHGKEEQYYGYLMSDNQMYQYIKYANAHLERVENYMRNNFF